MRTSISHPLQIALTTREGVGELGPFVEAINLKAWLHEMVLRIGPSAVIYANQFPEADPKLMHFLQQLGSELVLGFKDGRDQLPPAEGE